MLARLLDGHSAPGAALGILRGDEIVTEYAGAADVETGEPVTPETRFAVGSLCKSMVATAVARLVDARRLSFDDRVAAHVPELHGALWAERATVLDLLGNRSRVPLLNEIELSESDDSIAQLVGRLATARRRLQAGRTRTRGGACSGGSSRRSPAFPGRTRCARSSSVPSG